jgi:flagellar basal-body rod modification protein FlgD
MSGTSVSGAAQSAIASLNSTASTKTLASSSSSTGTASASSVNYNQFLTLLTTQMKYQDPMSPSDPTQFVAELAQFSSVEQQVQANTTLNTISQALGAGSLGQAASLLGHQVNAPATSYVVPSSGDTSTSKLQFAVTNSSLSNIHLAVTNSSNSVVATVPVTGANGTVSFNGEDSNGNDLGAGTYGLALVGTDSTGAQQTAGTLATSGTVQQVLQGSSTSGSGTWQLQLDNGSVVNSSNVTQLSSS